MLIQTRNKNLKKRVNYEKLLVYTQDIEMG